VSTGDDKQVTIIIVIVVSVIAIMTVISVIGHKMYKAARGLQTQTELAQL
jgi:hypothetical protein